MRRLHSFIGCIVTLMAMMVPCSFSAGAISHQPENRVIYEVFVRNFSQEGNFKGVEAQIPRLKELGVDVVWLMPIYTPGEEGRWGTYSSPYAVRDYKGLDPDYGTAADFRSLVNAIHENGMEIWLDWVANHTSKDNVWTKSNPGFYGSSFVSPNGWNDVYQLDFSNSAMHDAMIDAMQYWVDEFDVDGFRCDYASGPTSEFWSKATQRVLKNGERVAWLAEDDSKPELVSNGWFDYNYAWYFHDRLLDFARGGTVDNLRNECLNLHNEEAYRGRSRMVYLSNHDVVQDKGGTEVTLFHKYVRPLTVLEFTVFGMPLIYNGQEIGYNPGGSVSLAEKTPIDWSNPDSRTTELIRTLSNLKHTQPALNTGHTTGTLINHTATDPNVYVYERRQGDESVVVMLNFNDSQKTFSISGNLPGFTGKDAFTGNTGRMAAGESFTLPAQGYAVYVKDGEGGDLPIVTIPDTYNIYIKDETGWNDLYLYAYVDGAPSIFGEWPGVKVTETEVVNGVSYKVIRNVSATDIEQTFIANDNNGNQVDIAGLYTITENVYLTVGGTQPEEPTPSAYNIYIKDETGWNDLYLYAYVDGAPSIFGEWPGVKVTETEVVNGVSYKVIRNVSATDIEQTFIANDNNGNQVDIAGLYTITENVYLTVGGTQPEEPTPSAYNIYIKDETGWNDLYLYAYVEDAPSIFGEWPGIKVTDTEVIDGITYKVIKNITATEVPQNLIVNNNAGEQIDLPGAYTITENIFVSASHPAIYLLDNSGWDNLYLYAWGAGIPEMFGGWPGVEATEKVGIDGVEYLKVSFPEEAAMPSNLIFNNGDGVQFDGPTLDHVGSIYIKVEGDSFIVSDVPFPVYNIYIEDKTGWDRLYLYAYSNEEASLFGEWPGVEVSETVTIGDTRFKVVRNLPASDTEHSFIIHNNSGEQQDIDGIHTLTKHLYFASGSGVDSVESSDDVVVEYYNLQGMRILNPGKGIYICRKGNKVFKVVR